MFEFNTIEEALEDLRQGKLILVTDDEDRENEGDLICAAEFATTENVNFMAVHAKGLICMPMSHEYIKSFVCLKWWTTTPTITKLHLPFQSTISAPQPVYLLLNVR